MANFRVGQRVRIISTSGIGNWTSGNPIGREGVIVKENRRPKYNRWVVEYEGSDCANGQNFFGRNRAAFKSECLTPLTDPGVEQFMARIVQPVGCLDAPPKIRTKERA